ncbi:MAG: GNAT family N-acetyltransferase [bacterium]
MKVKQSSYVFKVFALSFICFLSTNAEIKLKWLNAFDSNDLIAAKDVFLESFNKSYGQIYTDGMIEVTNGKMKVDEFLNKVAEEDFTTFARKLGDSNFHFVVAKDEEKIVGFAMFTKDEKEEDEVYYIEHQAVSSDSWGNGIGKQLVLSIISKVDNINKIALVTRTKNEPAIKLYKKMGFMQTNYEHVGLNPDIYAGYELEITK